MPPAPITIRDSINTLCEWHNGLTVINSNPMKNVGEKIKKAREDRGLGRRELLERSGLGDSPPSRLANYESGLREPTLGDIEKLAAGMGLSLIQLLQYGDEAQLVVLSDSHRTLLGIWDNMEPEEQGLWLKRGQAILASRDAGDEDAALARDSPSKRGGGSQESIKSRLKI